MQIVSAEEGRTPRAIAERKSDKSSADENVGMSLNKNSIGRKRGREGSLHQHYCKREKRQFLLSRDTYSASTQLNFAPE